jgi:hypothetical protein
MKHVYSACAVFLLACGVAYSIHALWFHETSNLPELPGDMVADVTSTMIVGTWPKLDEIHRMPFRLEVNPRNIQLGCEELKILTDGRVHMQPFLATVFGKAEEGATFPDINTIRASAAYLTFDRPITSIAELGKRHLTALELSNNVCITNNRRNSRKDDDRSLTTPGPVFYHRDTNRIWTSAPVRIVDKGIKPEPMLITAEGMDLVLAPDTKDTRNFAINGVDSVVLHANVEMHFPECEAGFFDTVHADGGQSPKIIITTPGSLRYDMSKGQAHLEVPAKRGPLPEKVTVTRLVGPPGQEKHDFLYCDRLDFQFQRKANAVCIPEAHATGREVDIISEGEGMHAIGNDFIFKSVAKVRTLTGTPAGHSQR